MKRLTVLCLSIVFLLSAAACVSEKQSGERRSYTAPSEPAERKTNR